MSFNDPYLSCWPIPFPYGRFLVPIIAPYWTDLDFRNNNPNSRIYYNTYNTNGDNERATLLLDMFSERLQGYVGASVSFQPEWMAVITWNQATPYYWRYYDEQVYQ